MDKTTAKNILDNLHALLDGNGIGADDIKFIKGQTTDHIIKAHTHVSVRTEQESHVEAGRISNGTIITNPDQMHAATTNDKQNYTAIHQNLMQRGDKGIGIEQDNIDLPNNQKRFIEHQRCPQCQGKGQSSCPSCRGQGQIACTLCNGHRQAPCRQCRGTGNGPNGPNGQCTFCHGKRIAQCHQCHGRGQQPCRICHGKKTSQCPPCHGQGTSSKITTIKQVSSFSFRVDESDLAEPLQKTIENRGWSRLIEKKHIHCTSHNSEGSNLHYEIKIQAHQALLTLKDKKLKIHAIGPNGLILLMPPLIEILGKDNITALINGNIQKAVELRFIKETMIAVLNGKADKKTMKAMHKQYLVGIRKQTIGHIVQACHTTLKNLTSRPRWYGLGIGLLLTACLYGAYFVGPVRDIIDDTLTQSWQQIAADLILINIGAALTTFMMKFMAKRTMRQALQSLDLKHIPSPSTYGARWIGYAGGICLYICILELTRHTGDFSTPDWYLQLWRNL